MTEEILGSHIEKITRLLSLRADLAGDICEFGVYAGRTTEQLATLNRIVWAFDTFDGIPAESFTEGLDIDNPGKFLPPSDTLLRLETLRNVRAIVGRFEQTLNNFRRVKVVLAYLDCDLYLSAKCALAWLGKHLVEGGVIVLDDYATHPGIQKAVAEFLIQFPVARFDGAEVIYW